MARTERFSVMTGRGAAWRALYVSVCGRQVVSVGVDPHDGVKPEAFGNVWDWRFRFRLPTVHWRYPSSRARLACYRVSRWFWHNVDGRYGWGSKYRRQAAEERKAEHG